MIKHFTIPLFLFAILFGSLPLLTYATEHPTAIFAEEQKTLKLAPYVSTLEDTNGEYTINDLIQNPDAFSFILNKKTIPNFGYTTSTYWATFQIKNEGKETEKLLEIAYPPLNDIVIYVFDGTNIIEEVHLGAKYPFHKREIRDPHFLHSFEMTNGQTLQFYIRFRTDGSLQMPMTIYEKNGYIIKKQNEILTLGIIYGILGVMAIYNLFLYFSLRHKSYIFYVFVNLSTFFSNLTFSGLAYQYIWPNSPWWNMQSIMFFFGLGAIFSQLFTISFLNLPHYLPRGKRFFQLGFFVNTVFLISIFISYPFALKMMIISILMMVILVLTSAIMSWRRGARQARFFILAWFVFLMGILITILSDAALIPLTSFTKMSSQFAATIEVVLLSFALADRINILQNEKNEAVRIAQKNHELAMKNLQQADELKNEFLAITSHELRTPLYGMIGIAESLLEGAAGTVSRTMENHLQMIITSGQRLTNLVNELLDLSKLQHGMMDIRLQKIQLKELIDLIVPICEPLVQKRPVQIRNAVPHYLPSIYADQNRLMQIMYNLIGNAITHTKSGEIVISAEQRGRHIAISVADTGIGMNPEQLEKVFEPFQQGNAKTGGIGIGLNIVKHLIELHGGSIEVESTKGVGTIFRFTLPIDGKNDSIFNTTMQPFQSNHPHDEPVRIIPVNTPIRKQAHILIADDEPINIQILFNKLSLQGYDVSVATNGKEVLEQIKQQVFDLVILDIMMPELSGVDVCKEIRKQFSLTELPILMLTSKSMLQDKLTSFEVGVNDYLTKPCDTNELLSRVATLIALRKSTTALEQLNASLEQKVEERTHDLEKANADLKRMEQSRSELLSNITHELATPITIIQNYFQAVSEGLIDENDSHYLRIIHNKLIMLERLTRDLFELAKLKTGTLHFDFTFVPLHIWLEELIQDVQSVVERSERYFASDVWIESRSQYSLLIDPLRIQQVFNNLIWNAIEHTPKETGKIELHVRLMLPEQMEGRIDTNTTAKATILFIVKDNGEGIAKEHLPHLFERYFKAPSSFNSTYEKGSGLGLSIAKEIILTHQGKIWVDSINQKGSSFFLELPLFDRTTLEQEEL